MNSPVTVFKSFGINTALGPIIHCAAGSPITAITRSRAITRLPTPRQALPRVTAYSIRRSRWRGMAASLFMLSAVLAWPQASSPQPASSAPNTSLAAREAKSGSQSTSASNPSALTNPNSPASASKSTTSLIDLSAEPLVATPASTSSAPQPPQQPKTEIFDSSATGSNLETDGHDPILDPPPLPIGVTTLVGGTISSVDHIRNKMTITPFAGSRWKIAFDERTHVYLNGAETTETAIKKGERVYVDTMLDNQKHEVFARNISLGVLIPAADADGQIMELDEAHGAIVLRDQINSVPVHFSIDAGTRMVYGNKPISLHELRPGSLVHVKFAPGQSNRGLAREIQVIAAPGAEFTYVGKITYLDLHRGLLAIQDALDQKSYEIHFDPIRLESRNDLAVGSEVRIVAIFEGNRYQAQSVTLTKPADKNQ
jgi:hypothetical protein